ncbi:hypothetical protein EYV94_03455 [Puteibacter caeruleilacunae]|nr:hypothetical protein EYV94_03455 [Puteibacter caeruleilacunae]
MFYEIEDIIFEEKRTDYYMIRNIKTKQLKEVAQAVEVKFAHGAAREWKNRDFQDLSFEILKATKISVSPGTLKRIFGKIKTENDYFPQGSTLDALIQYAEFEWKKDAEIEQDSGGASMNNSKKYLGYLAVFVVIVCVVVWMLFPFTKGTPVEADFELKHVDGINPCTAYFKYFIPETEDSVFIDFGDARKPEHVKTGEGTISHYYEYPGVFHAAVVSRQRKISKKIEIKVLTTGWQSLVYYFKEDDRERYFPLDIYNCSYEGVFYPSVQYLSDVGVDTTKLVLTRLDNYFKTETSGDSFTMNARIKNEGLWSIMRCNTSNIVISGDKGKVQFSFVKPGCSRWLQVRLGEHTESGHSKDLSLLASDFTTLRNVQIINCNKQVELLLDGKKVYSGNYKQSMGKILGVSFIFHGTGAVDYCELKDGNGEVLLQEEF